MSMEKIKQKINYLINKRNSFWATAMLTISGTLTLLLKLKEGVIVYILIIAGIIASSILINSCILHENYIEKLINKLEGNKNDAK